MEAVKILVSTAAVAVTTSAFATDRYVSTNGVYGADVPGAVCYTDLQKAIDESANNDVVWVQDGFVCDEGENEAYTEWDKSKTKNRIAVVSKINLLVRSESGYVDEANGKGATIRGAYNSESEKCGAGSIRPILLHNQATLVGFVLENGSVNTNQPSVGGGGVWMYRSTLSNCVVRNCHATNGGGVFINQTLAGRGVFNTVVTNNTTTSYGGGVYGPADFRDCRIANNTASPTSSNSGCGGGAAGGAVLKRCHVAWNVASYRGGGAYNCKAYNSYFTGNQERDGRDSGGGGGAYSYASDSDEYCNCLFSGNISRASGSAAAFQAFQSNVKLVNCTIHANTNLCTAYAGVGGFNFGNHATKKGSMVNVISWGNSAKREIDSCGIASNCCFHTTDTGLKENSFNCIDENPRLTMDENGNLYPKNKKCVDTATVFDWMTDGSDVRSLDLAGQDRITGVFPDMGCFEKGPPTGLLLLFY